MLRWLSSAAARRLVVAVGGVLSAAVRVDYDDDVDVEQGSTLWYSCSYDWDTPSTAHTTAETWQFLFEPLMEKSNQFDELRKKANITKAEHFTQATVLNTTLNLLQSAGSWLDKLKVNWYVSYGTVVGELRSETFIPWDQDADILVKKSDRQRIVDWIVNGTNESYKTNESTVAVRADPTNPQYAIACSVYDGQVQKILWIDLKTDLAVDFCFDCELDAFGAIKTRMMSKPFGSSLKQEDGVDAADREIEMPLAKEHWSCKLYECAEEPERYYPDSKSLVQLYRTHATAMKGPFDFKLVNRSRPGSLPKQGFASMLSEASHQSPAGKNVSGHQPAAMTQEELALRAEIEKRVAQEEKSTRQEMERHFQLSGPSLVEDSGQTDARLRAEVEEQKRAALVALNELLGEATAPAQQLGTQQQKQMQLQQQQQQQMKQLQLHELVERQVLAAERGMRRGQSASAEPPFPYPPLSAELGDMPDMSSGHEAVDEGSESSASDALAAAMALSKAASSAASATAAAAASTAESSKSSTTVAPSEASDPGAQSGICALPRKYDKCKLKRSKQDAGAMLWLLPCGQKTA
eukprot:TRINITY_DN5550_c0_g1_i3.p1 TRINITY_DN5550_c0_g1~~TRINITY_DN5550_c0_g1_i3.p1  ORF type:complete len:579 (+),score=175.90 TRINITY_DN5550_c0_g1_i3:126-1862(+)